MSGDRPASGIPAKGSWPPFEPGNRLAERHGGYLAAAALSSEERTKELAEQIAASQVISHAADAGAVWRLAIVYRRCERALTAVEAADQRIEQAAAEGDFEAAGDALVEQLRRDLRGWLRLAGQIEADLGRNPMARAKLGLDAIRSHAELQRYLDDNYGGES
jgi:hypothetical protein